MNTTYIESTRFKELIHKLSQYESNSEHLFIRIRVLTTNSDSSDIITNKIT